MIVIVIVFLAVKDGRLGWEWARTVTKEKQTGRTRRKC